VLGLLGLPYEAPFFGRDVLHYPDPHRVLMFIHNQKVAICRDDELAILGLQRSASTVRHRHDPDGPRRARDVYEPVTNDPSLVDLATAYYQIGADMYDRGSYD
jgi:hypothetical protein